MQRVLITGAGRGIGLALARAYTERGDTVLAGVRAPNRAPGLQELQAQHGERITVIPLEVTSRDALHASVEEARKVVDGLDVLINNAAISPGDLMTDGPAGAQVLDGDRALEFFRVNTVAPLQVAQAFLPLLCKGKSPRIVMVSSGAGSLQSKTSGGLYSYSASKAALNMYTRALAWDLQEDGVIVIALDPGYARTDMGGPIASISPEESAEGVLHVIDGLTPESTGRFFHYQGGEVPW